MIFQDPLSSLHPFYTIGKQLVEAMRVHQKVSKAEALQAGASTCSTGSASPTPSGGVEDYPHQLSGGMRQRVMIAMALHQRPRAADRRRADHGPRRDRPGADPRAAARPADGVRHGDHPDHPRPRRRRRHGRRRRSHVRRPDRRARRRSRTSTTGPRCPTRWGLLGSVPRMDVEARRPAAADPRQAAVADPAAQGLRLPAALRLPRARARRPVRHRPPRPAAVRSPGPSRCAAT